MADHRLRCAAVDRCKTVVNDGDGALRRQTGRETDRDDYIGGYGCEVGAACMNDAEDEERMGTRNGVVASAWGYASIY